MWDRKELKAKGKAAYNANKIACIIAALILMIAGGLGSGSTASPSVTVRNQLNDNDQVVESYEEVSGDTGDDAVTIEVNGQDLDAGEINHNLFPMIAISSAVAFLILIAGTVGLMVLALFGSLLTALGDWLNSRSGEYDDEEQEDDEE